VKIAARWILVTVVVSLGALLSMTFGLPVVHGQAAHVRWDIISVNFATGTLSAGGIASAKANDNSKISLTGPGLSSRPKAVGRPAP
jgi:hypothetical protein